MAERPWLSDLLQSLTSTMSPIFPQIPISQILSITEWIYKYAQEPLCLIPPKSVHIHPSILTSIPPDQPYCLLSPLTSTPKAHHHHPQPHLTPSPSHIHTMPACFHLSPRTPILSSALTSPNLCMDEAEYRTYKLLKANVKLQNQERKQELKTAEKKRKEIEGETSCELFCSCWIIEGAMGANDCSPK